MTRIYNIILASILLMAAVSCESWLTPEPIYKEPYNSKTEEEWEALRAYKRSDHTISFGWYSSWTGVGNKMQNYLIGLPDSLDVVSHWNPTEAYVEPLTDAQKADLAEVHKKGTRVLFCLFFKELGFRFTPGLNYSLPTAQLSAEEREAAVQLMKDTWGWYGDKYDGSPEAQAAIRKYAQVMTKYVLENGYDGIDFDYEDHWGLSNGCIGKFPDAIHILIDELSKNFGPKSGTDRLLVVDGEPQSLNAETGPMIDYYIVQAYYCPGDSDLDARFEYAGPAGTPGLLEKFGEIDGGEKNVLRKTIWTEDFERHQTDGGNGFIFRYPHHNPGMEPDPNHPGYYRPRTQTRSLDGMARYNRYIGDEYVQVGGFGAFRFDIGRGSDDYMHMRRAIQAANPSPATLKILESQKVYSSEK